MAAAGVLAALAFPGSLTRTAMAQGPPLPQAASPFPGGLTGTLVFQSDRAGRDAIYTLDLASGRVAHLSGDPGWTEGEPRWSPDGSRIVFASNRAHYAGPSPEEGTPDMDLWLMDADGGNRRRLTSEPSNEQNPAWLPDGKSIVFTSDGDSRGDLYRVWIDGGKVDRLTRDFAGRAIMPNASPDGGRVAFAAQTLRVGTFWDYQVHVLDLGAGGTSALTSSAGACWPSWSRDGARMANVLLRQQRPSAIEVRVMASGTTTTVFDDARLWGYYPEWSPDNAKLAFSVSPEHHEGQDWDLAVLDLSSRKWQRLTTGGGNDRLPDWKP